MKRRAGMCVNMNFARRRYNSSQCLLHYKIIIWVAYYTHRHESDSSVSIVTSSIPDGVTSSLVHSFQNGSEDHPAPTQLV